MPVRQQYFIAAAVIGLIGVLVIFAMFDYFSDRSRFAEQMGGQTQGAVAKAPSPGSLNPAAFGNYMCPSCGWMRTGQANLPCPNCRAFLGGPNVGVQPGNVQNAAFDWFHRQPTVSTRPRGTLYCPGCDFVMSTKHIAVPNSIRCPRCPAYLVTSDTAGSSIAGNAGAGQQAVWGLNSAPAYNPSYPIPAQQGALYGFGGQQVEFVPGQGRGLNPYCPIR